MAKAAKQHAPVTSEPSHDITPIPLHLLDLSPLNVRRVTTDVTDLEANIAANGLLQSLVVVPSVKGALITNAGNMPMYDVVCGGRRLQALDNLHQADRLPRDFPVPCRIVTTEQAVALSLSENQQREPMHPIDEAVAFAELVAQKTKPATIATLFGVSKRYVAQRLKLASLAPALIEASRRNELPLDMLEAFTLCDDHVKQFSVWSEICGDVSEYGTDDVRDMLTSELIEATDARVKLIGLDAYREAGGTFVNDLFSEEDELLLLADGKLIDKLARKKLQKLVKPLEAEGWKWVAIDLNDEINGTTDSGTPRDSTVAEAKELDALEAEREAIFLNPDRSSADEPRIRAINTRIDDIEAAQYEWAPWVKGIAGAVITLRYNGTPSIERGVIREDHQAEYCRLLNDHSETQRQARELEKTNNTTESSQGAGGAVEPPAPNPPPKPIDYEKEMHRAKAEKAALMARMSLVRAKIEDVRKLMLEYKDDRFKADELLVLALSIIDTALLAE